jgi:tRNA/tmRNA/rRNA uracil-C5-methylase (TrmA/RlmC/RlmD family)
VHPGAAAVFVDTVLDWLQPATGERAIDLYAGVGLFAAALADAVGESGAVLAVEAEGPAMVSARSNLVSRPWVELRPGRVERVLKPLVRQGIRADIVALDPPRTGAGRQVVEQLAALAPRAIGYVACDPAALARDTAYLHDVGFRLRSLRAFDAFPMTHHMECVALFEPAAG